jgi:hypothetical protein
VEKRGFMGKAEGLWEPWGQGQGQGQGHGGDKGPCGIMGDLGGVAWFGRVL